MAVVASQGVGRCAVLAACWLLTAACGQSDEGSKNADEGVAASGDPTTPEAPSNGSDTGSDDDNGGGGGRSGGSGSAGNASGDEPEPSGPQGTPGSGPSPATEPEGAAEPEASEPVPGEPEPSESEPAVSPEPAAPEPEPSEPEATPEPGVTPDPAPEPAPVTGGSGCSAGASPADGPQTIDVDGTERSYIVSLPDGYDPETPYPLVFAFHGLGGSGQLVTNPFYFGIEQAGGKPTIFVYPDGLDTGMGAGWANDGGQDVAFFDAMLASLQENYCVDSSRVFSTGHSYGGIMTHTLACERAPVLRAIAPVAGAFFSFRGADCTGPVAAWGAHGNPDNTVDYESGLSAIQRVMETNGCDPDSGMPVEPTEFCTLYSCDEGYPVTWCVHDQDHDWPPFAAESIKAFFDSF